jgi:cell filamentation protein
LKDTDRYSVPENESYEPGSNDEVLKNYLHIISKEKIDEVEASELQRTGLELRDIVEKNHICTAEDICNFHELWLGDVYPFAGKYRTVHMSKAGFPFAAPNFIPKLMNEFEKSFLKKHTPCDFFRE